MIIERDVYSHSRVLPKSLLCESQLETRADPLSLKCAMRKKKKQQKKVHKSRMQFSFCSRHHPPTCTKRLIATHFGAPRPFSSATALGCNRSRSQPNTLPPSSEGAGTGWSMDFQTDEPHWVIQSASLLSAPSTEDHQTATALCSYCMRKRPEGRGLWGGKTKTRKSTKLFFLPP